MRILAIDPSLKATGWAVLSCVDHKRKIVDYGVIKTKSQTGWDKILERLSDIGRQIEVAFRLIAFTENICDTVIMEFPNTGKHGVRRTIDFIKLGMACGVIHNALKRALPNIPIHMVTPREWKANDPKENTSRLVAQNYKLKDLDPNIIDAIGIGDYWIGKMRLEGKK
jgi:Holliday junction resolvasome RuvABC endonuclease subunit